MLVPRVNVLLICGGAYHDMDYARLQLLGLLAEHEQIRVRVAEDYSNAEAFAKAGFLVTYTSNVLPDASQLESVRAFLARGGRWLALHGTNSILRFKKGAGWDAPREAPEFMTMLGSQFVAHPPIAPYRVDVVDPSHPLVSGIEPFEADDELYLCEYHGDAEVLLQTHFVGEAPGFVESKWPQADRADAVGAAQRVLYLHRYGGGEVLYCMLGHCRGRYDMQPLIKDYPQVERGSWKRPAFWEILRRGIRWGARIEQQTLAA